jgi:hypothetical protein
LCWLDPQAKERLDFLKKTEPNLTLQLNYTQLGRERLILQIESAKSTEFFGKSSLFLSWEIRISWTTFVRTAVYLFFSMRASTLYFLYKYCAPLHPLLKIILLFIYFYKHTLDYISKPL